MLLWQRSGGTGRGSHIAGVVADSGKVADMQRPVVVQCGQNSKRSACAQGLTVCEESAEIKVYIACTENGAVICFLHLTS